MIAILVRVRVREDGRERFLQGIETDALGSERDEPGCYRFNVLQDSEDDLVYYFYEVYEDEAALEAHRPAAPLPSLGSSRRHAGRRRRNHANHAGDSRGRVVLGQELTAPPAPSEPNGRQRKGIGYAD